jgi:hypothetical protein
MTRLFDVLRGCRVPLAVVAFAAVAGCGKVPQAGDANSYLIISSLAGPGGNFLNSLASGPADNGSATLALAMRDPGGTAATTSPSSLNFITVNRYHVDFVRADGYNVQGVDVPYSFDGAITATVGLTPVTATFPLVRAQAKQEAPLLALANSSGAVVISTLANVTFYGADQVGHDVSVTGTIGVNFSK